VLAQKLKALKSNSRKLNEKVFGNVAKQQKEMEGFRELDLIAEEGSLSFFYR
jgi:heme-degrading monooxygenase HmoA